MSFTMTFMYYITGLRVNGLTALYWNDIDLINSQIKVYHNLDFTNSDVWTRKTKMKTEAGRRIISLDEDTISVLKS